MPFVQRVVQPIHLAQIAGTGASSPSTSSPTKFQCIPGKCNNNYCTNKLQQNLIENAHCESPSAVSRATTTTTTTITLTTTKTLERRLTNEGHVADTATPEPLNGIDYNLKNDFDEILSYPTDNEADTQHIPAAPSASLSLKKLKKHVEFLSTAPSTSPSRSLAERESSVSNSSRWDQQRQRTTHVQHSSKIITGYEFESISNLTLSNALRQLASLVLIASDIFDDLQQELQSVGDRAGRVQRKLVFVERHVCAFDPKLVTVPESDLLTFAQRKIHFETETPFHKELFTVETRPRSVRMLYEDAGRKPLKPSMTTTTSFTSDGTVVTDDGAVHISGTGATMAAGSDELVCTPLFGNANRKMRTRIDSEIEIRLPAGIEDLRKWTSSEALGDVTVTPDCMHHVDTSICTSMIIGDNGVLTPALSPSVLSADAVDALYSISVSNTINDTQLFPNDINKDVPLNHRLPSPEEQTKIIALKYPAEVISVDTSGKRFQRMCLARKSTTGCFTNNIAESNNLNDEIQTVSRRSRSRKVRCKRRNTIAGIDQKEIQDAANGESTANGDEIRNTLVSSDAATQNDGSRRSEKSTTKKFGRSKSSDILKKESVALPYDKGKSTLTRLNSLKQWGRNRFKFMQHNEPIKGSSIGHDTSGCSSQNTSSERADCSVSDGVGGASNVTATKITKIERTAGRDIDDECVVHELITQKSESRFSHERKSSYSSSEKSMSVSSSGHLRGKLHLVACGNVKLRDTSSLNRQRRNGISTIGLAGKDEQPHSSSGNWSASSESGRASIGSEITIQPKSSASNTSLNVSSFHPGSGPPSSMMSRRRFLNTSASSSVTSEGTATPELQVVDGNYPGHLDDETSSAYSCDTEGYYTSFHMDSGLRTLKEEEPPITLLQQENHNLHTSNYSFGSQSNQTVVNAENEYELFGHGSTSTTTSSAGTVCTTLMINGEQSSLNDHGPDVPERISSLAKLNKNGSSNSASSSTLERSYSSSTIGSTLERTGTIKRNVNAGLKLVKKEIEYDVDEIAQQPATTPESQDDEFEFGESIRQRTAQPLPQNSLNASIVAAEIEYSESSDLEGVERIERIKQKTALNAKRIPSMCIITPTTSDDENQSKCEAYDPNRTLTMESSPCSKAASKAEALLENIVGNASTYCEVDGVPSNESLTPTNKDHNLNVLKRHTHKGLNNMFEKLKVVLPNMKRTANRNSQQQPPSNVLDDDDLYDTAGEYVTIADISNNNQQYKMQAPKAVFASSLGIYYSNDIVRRRQEAGKAQPNEPQQLNKETEYVSLNELPHHLRRSNAINGGGITIERNLAEHNEKTSEQFDGHYSCADSRTPQNIESSNHVPMYAEISEFREEKSLMSPTSHQKGAHRVRLNAEGKIIYDSDSLKRRKGAHTTFAPGPFVKETESALCENVITTSQDTTRPNVGVDINKGNHITSESGSTRKNVKLLLLNGEKLVNRKIANVRPILAKSLHQRQQEQEQAQQQSLMKTTENSNMASSYLEQKNLLANSSNPFFHSIQSTTSMMPSPSTKSTSSTGSSSTTVSTTSSSMSKDEGYQRLSKTCEPQNQSLQTVTDANGTPFQRNAPIYWTLQSRRQPKTAPSYTASRDDLYATPIRRSERTARAVAAANAAKGTQSNLSPIVPRNHNAFLTSTPTRGEGDVDQQLTLPANNVTSKLPNTLGWDTNSPERLNTCADRIGTSKTSLMDFKRLLLAKAAKSSPVPRKVSAVEMLKKKNPLCTNPNGSNAGAATPSQSTTSVNAINSSLKLLDLSGSPKTFANRRMLRQGQFGSPSKTFAPKLKTTPAAWRSNVSPVQRTDIMSITIPEANSEEDHSNTSGSKSSRDSSETEDGQQTANAASNFDLKRNFFLQTEENNFMRGELKHNFHKNIVPTSVSVPIVVSNVVSADKSDEILSTAKLNKSQYVSASTQLMPEQPVGRSTVVDTMPALETAL